MSTDSDFFDKVRIDGGFVSSTVALTQADMVGHLPPCSTVALVAPSWADRPAVLVDDGAKIYHYGPGRLAALREGNRPAGLIAYRGNVPDLHVGVTPPCCYRTDAARGLFQLGSFPADTITCEVSPVAQIATMAASGDGPYRAINFITTELTDECCAKLTGWTAGLGHASVVAVPSYAETIAALTDELQIARELIATLSQRPLAMSGDVPSTDEVRTDRNPEPANPVREHVDAVIDDLTGRKVAARDRERLGDALADANDALRGRDGADSAIGHAIGRPKTALIGLRTCP